MIELAFHLPLRGLVLEVSTKLEHKVTAIVGPSGAGKTSLLEVIAGLRKGARGRVVIEGVTLLDSNRGIRMPPEKRRVGYVPQQPALFPHLTVDANIRYGLRDAAPNGFVDEIIDLADLARLLNRYPRTLSGGEAQRVALARALVVRPNLLLLDEPLAALDVDLRSRLLPYVMRVRERSDTPMLYVTHDIDEALAIADEALVLKAGQVHALGNARAVLTAGVAAQLDDASDGDRARP